MFQLAGLASNLVLILISVFAFFVYYFKKTHDQWRKQGIPCFLSPTEDMFFLRKNKGLAIQERYQQMAPHPCGGVWLAAKPYLIVRDPQLVQTILIKAFSHFTDRGLIMPEDINPLSVNIFNQKGLCWRTIRAKLVPTFSTLKLKSMYTLMEECAEVLNRHIAKNLKDTPAQDIRDLMLLFTTDVIGMCAFSFDCQTISDAKSVFRQVGLKFTPNWVYMAVRESVAAISPRIVSWLNWTNIHPDLKDFFHRVTEDTIKTRNENRLEKRDFMQLLINAQQEEQKQIAQNGVSELLFTNNTMIGQVFLFFVAGIESSSIALGYCLYELALNPDIMEKLYVEVKEAVEAHEGKLDYDILKGMLFLECVILETLRKYPPVGWLDRVCTKTFEDPASSLVISQNTNILIPVYALHHDPQYFPEPEKFNPDRFNAQNKANILPGTFLPFGDGPRVCIGMKFSLMEMKLALVTILRNYTVHPTEKLPIPVAFDHRKLFNISNQALYLRFQRRSE